MGYRRFMALLSGLSGESVFFYRLHEKKKEEKNKPIEGAQNIAANIAAKMSRKRK